MAKDFFRGMNKVQITEAVRAIVNPAPLRQEFESDLICDLIAEKHYVLSLSKQTPTKFRKLYAKTTSGYDFEGFFPGVGWRKVSWLKCITEPGPRQFLTQSLRDAVRLEIIDYKAAHPCCEVCCEAPVDDVDHVEPEFKDIVDAAIGGCTGEELQALLQDFNFWEDEPFVFPKNSDAFRRFKNAHDQAVLRAVCKTCHQKQAKERRVS